MTDDPAPLLRGPGQEARHVDERDERHVERVAGAHEPGRLVDASMSSTPGERARLVADHTDRVAAEPREPADDVLREPLAHLQELAAVDDPPDHLVHVVGLVRMIRNQRVELRILPVDRIRRRAHGGRSALFCGRNESR